MPQLHKHFNVGGNYDFPIPNVNNFVMFEKLRRNKKLNALEKSKNDLVEAVSGNIYSTQQNINELCQVVADFKKNNYSNHDSFFNLCIFSDIVSLDLTILLEKVRLASREQEKKLFVRVIALTIIDYLDNVNVLLGRDCLAELKGNNMTQFLEEFKSLHKKFSSFKRSNERLLRDIRNKTIAHKSKDALELVSALDNINIDDIYNFGLEVKLYSKEFIDLSTKVIYYIVDYMRAGRRL